MNTELCISEALVSAQVGIPDTRKQFWDQFVLSVTDKAGWAMYCPDKVQYQLGRGEAGDLQQLVSKLAVIMRFGDHEQLIGLGGKMFDFWMPSQFFSTVANTVLGDRLGK